MNTTQRCTTNFTRFSIVHRGGAQGLQLGQDLRATEAFRANRPVDMQALLKHSDMCRSLPPIQIGLRTLWGVGDSEEPTTCTITIVPHNCHIHNPVKTCGTSTVSRCFTVPSICLEVAREQLRFADQLRHDSTTRRNIEDDTDEEKHGG